MSFEDEVRALIERANASQEERPEHAEPVAVRITPRGVRFVQLLKSGLTWEEAEEQQLREEVAECASRESDLA